MPKKTTKTKTKTSPSDEKPQSARFIEAGEKAGIDAQEFERVLGKIAVPKKPKS